MFNRKTTRCAAVTRALATVTALGMLAMHGQRAVGDDSPFDETGQIRHASNGNGPFNGDGQVVAAVNITEVTLRRETAFSTSWMSLLR